LPQILVALLGGVALFILLVLASIIAFDVAHAGQVYPGVSVAGVELSNLSPQEAASRLSESLNYPQTGRIVFKLDEKLWVARPAELGLYLDTQTSAQAAFLLGRQGNPIARILAKFRAWYQGTDLAPLLVYDQRVAQDYLQQIAAQIDKPTVEASLRIDGINVIVQPGQVGHSLNLTASMAPLEGQLRSLTDGLVSLVMDETPPVILDASAQAEIARKILSAPLSLSIPDKSEGDPGPWTFDQAALAKMLTIERVEGEQGAHYQVALNTENLHSFLQDLEPSLARQPANARFIFNDETHQLEVIQSAIIGRALNIEASLQAINEKITQGEHTIALVVNVHNPAVGNDATAESLGIRELVSVQTSYFGGSSASRIQNIKAASSRFHGVLVPPGATFSMAEVLGDVSLDNGYAEALIIYGNRTIKGVGGGVCQVSTTLFRTAFFGAYPIGERYSHAYRVSYYEYDPSGRLNPDLVGLDATVFVPVVDLKFTNDTPNWLLMETYVKAATLTWKFYSTSDARRVEMTTTGVQNVVEAPEPLYQENPDLSKGEIRQVDWEAEGADVTVYRTVYRNDQVYLQDEFYTHYLPWRAVYEYGPGTKVPKNND